MTVPPLLSVQYWVWYISAILSWELAKWLRRQWKNRHDLTFYCNTCEFRCVTNSQYVLNKIKGQHAH